MLQIPNGCGYLAPAMPPADPTSPIPAPASPGAPSPEPTLADVLAEVRNFKAEVEGRFQKTTKDLLGVRHDVSRTKGGAPSGEPQPAPPVTADDLNAAMRLGGVAAGLPPAARARVEAMTAEGRSYRDALAFAEALAESISQVKGSETPPSNGQAPSATPRPTFTGSSATPAHSPAVSLPGSLQELQAIARQDKARFKAIMATEGFDPYKLPAR